jgi:hypothetical protein
VSIQPSAQPSVAPSVFAPKTVTFSGFPFNDEGGATIEIHNGPNALTEGSTSEFLPGSTIWWRVHVHGYVSGLWFNYVVPNIGSPELDVSIAFTNVTVVTPSDTAKIFLQSLGRNLSNADSIILPSGAKIKYRAIVSKAKGTWKTDSIPLHVSNAAIDAIDRFGSMPIVVPNTAGGAFVEFLPIFEGGSRATFKDGDSVFFPLNITSSFKYRVAINGYSGPWQSALETHDGSSSPSVLNTTADFVSVHVLGLPSPTHSDTATPSVEVRKVSSLVTGDTPLVLPVNATRPIKWRALVNGYKGGWHDHDISDLGSNVELIDVEDEFCRVKTFTSNDFANANVLLDFVGRYAPKKVSASNEEAVHLLAGKDIKYRVRGTLGNFNYSVPDVSNCPAILDVGHAPGRKLIRGV